MGLSLQTRAQVTSSHGHTEMAACPVPRQKVRPPWFSESILLQTPLPSTILTRAKHTHNLDRTSNPSLIQGQGRMADRSPSSTFHDIMFFGNRAKHTEASVWPQVSLFWGTGLREKHTNSQVIQTQLLAAWIGPSCIWEWLWWEGLQGTENLEHPTWIFSSNTFRTQPWPACWLQWHLSLPVFLKSPSSSAGVVFPL